MLFILFKFMKICSILFVDRTEELRMTALSRRMDLQKNDLSLRNLEELCEKTSSHLAVIHRSE
jgi:hypothetical protein